MGPPIIGGLSGWMIRFTGWAVLDRLVNLLTLATTIHNAQQLSSNIFVTLITVMQNVVDFFGIKDSEGKVFSISSLIGQTLTSLVTLIVGEENYNNFAKEWAKYNRTYQAAANLFSSAISMGDSITQALQVVSSQTGKIGNALRSWSVVGEAAYGWMNITPNFSNPFLIKLQSLNEAASIVEQVSQEPLNVKSAKEELETASIELSKSLTQEENSSQGKEVPEAKKVKKDEDAKEAESIPPDTTTEDVFKDD
jgi:hypothetical protein